jgi:hypothetical protein
MARLIEFVKVWREYRPNHTFLNTYRIARDIAFYGAPF